MRNLFLILTIIQTNILGAQNVTFIYELTYQPQIDNVESISGNYYLEILGKQSVFRSEQARRSDSLKEKTGFGSNYSVLYSDQIYIQKNIENSSIIKSIITPLINDQYFIKIDDKLNWNILPDKLKIGDFDCQKATVQYGGRNWIAWFTQSIPLQEGPYVFHGLPGLILKIFDDKNNYNFNLVKTENSTKKSLFYLRKGKEINWEMFKKMQLDYYNDPYAGIKASGLKSKMVDINGNTIEADIKTISQLLQKRIKENNNNIEINKAITYD